MRKSRCLHSTRLTYPVIQVMSNRNQLYCVTFRVEWWCIRQTRARGLAPVFHNSHTVSLQTSQCNATKSAPPPPADKCPRYPLAFPLAEHWHCHCSSCVYRICKFIHQRSSKKKTKVHANACIIIKANNSVRDNLYVVLYTLRNYETRSLYLILNLPKTAKSFY